MRSRADGLSSILAIVGGSYKPSGGSTNSSFVGTPFNVARGGREGEQLHKIVADLLPAVEFPFPRPPASPKLGQLGAVDPLCVVLRGPA